MDYYYFQMGIFEYFLYILRHYYFYLYILLFLFIYYFLKEKKE